MHRFDFGAEAADRSHQRQCGVEDMRRKIAHVAVRPATRAPRCRLQRIGAEVLGVLAAKPRDSADLAVGDDLAGQLRGRRADIVEARHVDEAAGLGCREHVLAFVGTKPQRLLAEYMLAGSKCRECNLLVRVLGTGDHHCINARVGNQRAPIRCGTREPELPRLFRRTFRRGGADHLERGAQCRIEDRGDSRHGHRMGLAHVAAAHDADADTRHGVTSICKRLQQNYTTPILQRQAQAPHGYHGPPPHGEVTRQ